jgi:ATP-dependent Lon protease
VDLVDQDGVFTATVAPVREPDISEGEAEAWCRSLMEAFERYVEATKKVPAEVLTSISGIQDPSRLVDTIGAQLSLRLEEKKTLLETDSIRARMDQMAAWLSGQIEMVGVDKKIRGRVKKQMEKSQREYYLNEQMKAIQKELGSGDEGPSEIEQLQSKVDDAGMSQEAKKKTDSEIKKLKMMSPMSAEATVVRSYIDWMLSVPWKKRSKIRSDIKRA